MTESGVLPTADPALVHATGGAMDGSLELRYARKNGKDTVTVGPWSKDIGAHREATLRNC